MVQLNFLILAVAALIPLAIGFIWYMPQVFGNAWMKASNMNEEQMKGANMLLIFGLTYILGFMASMALSAMVIHQFAIGSILAETAGIKDPSSEVGMWLTDFMNKYGNNFRTFKHGVFHGVIAGIFFVTPVIAVNAMFERKGFKYIAINAGFWMVCLALMGGVICQFN